MKKYWRSTEELVTTDKTKCKNGRSEAEFSIEGLTDEEIKIGFKTNRRDFLKVLGFSAGYLAFESCKQPVRKAIPFFNKAEEITPGEAIHYASTYFDGHDYASVLVKVRDGRPIKIEGNELSILTKGGTSARAQASVLSLYDSSRQKYPLINGQKTNWKKINQEISTKLEKINEEKGKIVILSSTIISPSTVNLFEDFKKKFPTTEVVYYDSVSYSAMLEANKKTFGKNAIPSYRFDKAKVIVAFNADFLGTWLSPTEFTKQYSETRDLTNGKTSMSKHYQFETNLSITGSNADTRFPIKPSDEKIILINLYNKIAERRNAFPISVKKSPININEIANELLKNKSKSLIVSGTNDIYIQAIVNAINSLLKNIGNTIDFKRTTLLKQANDKSFNRVVEQMNNASVKGLIMYNVNPVYDYYNAKKFVQGLKKVELSISFSQKKDESSKYVNYLCPDNHPLESWSDAEAYSGIYSLGQPCIRNIFDTQQAQQNLMSWAGIEGDYHSYIKKYWERNLFTEQIRYISFREFWNHSLQKGVFNLAVKQNFNPKFNFDFIKKNISKISKTQKAKGIECVLYENVALGNGIQANNPWLQELPDPISKIVWDNYVAVSPKFAKDKGWKQEDVLKVNNKIELPILIQSGQAYGAISIALGYGRTDAGKVAKGVGGNAFSLVQFKNSTRQYLIDGVSLKRTAKTYPLASTQTHHSMEGREIVKETTLNKYKKNKSAGNESHKRYVREFSSMYPKQEFPGASWGMSIDLNKCIGCNACIVACQAENNIAVIGKEEVKNRRIMHWIRIDRYYSTESDKVGASVENENPEVLHQVVMCQHGDNAPCENVCPVSATPHTKEGLNSMAYNRCIGTRYCMNNCPYSVRRFNWYKYTDNKDFDYNFNDDLNKMVLNPDVVVRERGVVEKCSFCVQRIQEKKIQAKQEGRELVDGEIKPACVQTCPSKAITFGDMNKKDSKITKHFKDERAYGLLEELNTLPSVVYLTKVRNKNNVGKK
ncbi:MAG: TAT-variant-translocated molybdopterin oxidoreductase [Bacteroidota bacterium]|nr:TAT-variant-translocated molybdopterin oxidoreductase [Bacteroidota bacterium]